MILFWLASRHLRVSRQQLRNTRHIGMMHSNKEYWDNWKVITSHPASATTGNRLLASRRSSAVEPLTDQTASASPARIRTVKTGPCQRARVSN